MDVKVEADSFVFLRAVLRLLETGRGELAVSMIQEALANEPRAPCVSTHGAAGYAPGSAVIEPGEGIIRVRCGACGEVVPYVKDRGL